MLEYMKVGQVVTHPCVPLQKIEFFMQSPSPSPEHTYLAHTHVCAGSCTCHTQSMALSKLQ